MENENKNFRGGVLLTRVLFVKKKFGQDGIRKIRSEILKLGYNPPDPENIKIAAWYPNRYNIAFLKAFKETYGDKQFVRLAKNSPFEKVGFVTHFVKWPDNPRELIENSGELWSLFYDFGKIGGEMTGERDAKLRGYDISDDPVFCEYLTYYFESLMEKITKSKVDVKHIKCTHRGGEHEEWLMQW